MGCESGERVACGDGVSKVVSRRLPREDDDDRQRRFEPGGGEQTAAEEAEVRAA